MTPLSSSALLLASLALLSPAPAAAQASAPPQSAPSLELTAPRAARTDRNLISAQDISGHPSANAYELVRALHPQWLRGRGQTSLTLSGGGVRVYQDGQPVGGAEALRRITSESIGELRFVDSREAVLRWGADDGGGAILVTTR
jgi:hypothetical protein